MVSASFGSIFIAMSLSIAECLLLWFWSAHSCQPLLDLLSLKIINNPIEGLVHDLVTLQERRQVDILQTCQKELVNGIVPLVIQCAQFIKNLLRNDPLCMRHSLNLPLCVVLPTLLLRDQQVIDFQSLLDDLPLQYQPYSQESIGQGSIQCQPFEQGTLLVCFLDEQSCSTERVHEVVQIVGLGYHTCQRSSAVLYPSPVACNRAATILVLSSPGLAAQTNSISGGTRPPADSVSHRSS